MTILFSVAFFILGAVLASFTGVISERVYTGQSWLKGRSRCNSCRRTLDGLDLVPVLSWLLHKGRCRTCHARVPIRYALFELTLGALFVTSFATFGLTRYLAFFLATLTVLTFVVLYDLRHMVVPVVSSALLIVLSLICALLSCTSLASFGLTLFAAALIAGAFYLLYLFSKGRAMGVGDTPVAFALSLLAGSHALAGVLFSFWIGAAVGIVVLVRRRGGPKMGIEVPFVPFLALGFLLALFTQWNPFSF